MSLVEMGKPAIDYANSRLNAGLSLGRCAQSALSKMTAFAVIEEGVTRDRALRFAAGGLGRCDMGEVVVMLRRRFPSCSIIVELPLWLPTDPGVAEGAVRTSTCGSEVYAICSLNASQTLVEETLRTADPSFMYNAIIAKNVGGGDLFGCPTGWVESGMAKICGVLVGAYDGEGFVLAELPGLDPVV